jgi:hypothetical protein
MTNIFQDLIFPKQVFHPNRIMSGYCSFSCNKVTIISTIFACLLYQIFHNLCLISLGQQCNQQTSIKNIYRESLKTYLSTFSRLKKYQLSDEIYFIFFFVYNIIDHIIFYFDRSKSYTCKKFILNI